LYALDRELIYPKSYGDYFPEYVNHMVHTAVVPFQVIGVILTQGSKVGRFISISRAKTQYLHLLKIIVI
jgi:hypothetical protein